MSLVNMAKNTVRWGRRYRDKCGSQLVKTVSGQNTFLTESEIFSVTGISFGILKLFSKILKLVSLSQMKLVSVITFSSVEM